MNNLPEILQTEQKIAFCFLVNNNLQKEDIWTDFFKQKKHLCNLYFHCKDENSVTQQIVSSNKTIKRINTAPGSRHIVWAINILLSEAFSDESNKYFVLLSESCIPLYKFSYIYKKITTVSKSWIYYYKWQDSENIKRYNSLTTESKIPYDDFYRQNPYMILTRDHVKMILENTSMFDLFTRMKFPQEHYYITLLKKVDEKFDSNNICYPPTHVYRGNGHTENGKIAPIKELNVQEMRFKDSREIPIDGVKNEDSLFFRKVCKDTVVINEKFEINKYFDKIYCINLKRRPDRWNKVSEKFKKLGLEVVQFPAIDGDEISDSFDAVNKDYQFDPKSIKSKYALGCLLSHVNVWKDAKEKNYNRILVFEDDVLFSKYFTEKITDINEIDWELVYLGASQNDWNNIQFITEEFYFSKNTLGTFAYALDSKLYDAAIELGLSMRKPIDELLTELQEKNYKKCFTFYPNIVIADVTDSDIRPERDINTIAQKRKWILENFDIPTKTPVVTSPDIDKNVTFLIKSFMRKESVENLIKSIRKFYPNTKIVVVDDSKKPLNFDAYNVKTYNIEFDAGLAAGRNFGVSKIDTKYFVLLDDDFEFTENTNIQFLYNIITKHNLDILGGQVIQDNKPMRYFGNFVYEKENKMLYVDSTSENMVDYKKCNVILNFFIARTDKIKIHTWDNKQKLAEHSAFFFEHRDKLNVGYVENVSILHKKIKTEEYGEYRNRGVRFFDAWMARKDINYYINANNHLTINSEVKANKKIISCLAVKNLKDIDQILRKQKILYWIQDGTLLGYYRDKKFIEHDTDTDIGIMFEDFKPSTLKLLENAGFKIRAFYGYPNTCLEISLERFGTKTDIFFFYRKYGYVYHSAFEKNKINQEYNIRIDYRYDEFNVKEIDFLGTKLFAPSDELKFIVTKYGINWKIPDPLWDYAHSPKNSVINGEFIDKDKKIKKFQEWRSSTDETIKRIITYGTFDTFHYGHMELLRKAKELGNYLIVGLSTDEFNIVKGKHSKFSYSKRCEWLKNLSYVDEIIPENSWDQKERDIKKYNIDYMVMGDDWLGKFDNIPCKMIYLSRTPEISSTKIKNITSKKPAVEDTSKLNDLNKNVTLLIKSFMRKDSVDRQIESIRKYYSEIKIVVVDDSNVPMNFDYDKNIKTYNIAFDSGLSYGRNFGISKIDTEYFVLLDDDYLFTPNTDLMLWLNIIKKSDMDIIGGEVIENGLPLEYCGNFYRNGTDLFFKNEKYETFSDYATCDMVSNFFIAKTEVIKGHKWDDRLKLCEHAAYFFKYKGLIKVAHTNKISILHDKVISEEYKKYRNRSRKFLGMWMESEGIRRQINPSSVYIKDIGKEVVVKSITGDISIPLVGSL